MFVYVSLCEWGCSWKPEERGGGPGVMGSWALSVRVVLGLLEEQGSSQHRATPSAPYDYIFNVRCR